MFHQTDSALPSAGGDSNTRRYSLYPGRRTRVQFDCILVGAAGDGRLREDRRLPAINRRNECPAGI